MSIPQGDRSVTVALGPDRAAPRCGMCELPARWVTPRGRAGYFGRYCCGSACNNPVRICQALECRKQFRWGVGDAGSKYCSASCSAVGRRPQRAACSCAWCGASAARHNPGSSVWPYVCRVCLEPLRAVEGRLRDHRVPLAMVRTLLSQPGCQICGADLLTPVRGSDGKVRAELTVDHDHQCCAGAKSCGTCVRGFLCRRCNSAIGLLGDDPHRMIAAFVYLGGGHG